MLQPVLLPLQLAAASQKEQVKPYFHILLLPFQVLLRRKGLASNCIPGAVALYKE